MDLTSVISGIGSQRLFGSPDVCIAVLDGPVDLSHDCFAGADVTLIESITRNERFLGASGSHGTHVASVLFGQQGSGVDGLAPQCRGLVIPIFEDDPNGNIGNCSQLDLARAITRAIEHNADVINISAGQLEPSGEAHPILLQALELCRSSSTLVVAAAGNDGCPCLHIPAAVPSVIAVGAMDILGNPLDFSNWGGPYFETGILANGDAVLGAKPGGGTVERSGTSYATPIVSGAVAVLLSEQFALGGSCDPERARQLIFESAISTEVQPASNADKLLAGRLNLKGALRLLHDGKIKTSDTRESEKDMTQIDQQETINEPVSAIELSEIGDAPVADAPPQVPPSSVLLDTQPKEARPIAEVPVASQPPATTLNPSSLPAPFSPTPALTPSTMLSPSECAECAAEGAAENSPPPSLGYVLGMLDYDLVSEARRDSLIQMGMQNPNDRAEMVAYLDENPSHASSITWVITLEDTPLYVIQPTGPFAANTYEILRQFLKAQLTEGVERISVPGWVSGKANLFNGSIVPVLWPEARGMYSWSTDAIVEAAIGSPPPADTAAVPLQQHQEKRAEIENFLERVYYEVSNLGVLPQDRALNFAATNAYQVERVYHAAIMADMKLDGIDVSRSSYGRPESDCWDVKLRFFNPGKRMEQAREVFRFTVDVSDLIPVTVGKVRRWHMY